ncbi:hypothetical protein [Saccharibacillus alkalitolerans]|uniref:DUF2199 domain-containing protein n=1 Tax=Saccharibacillus alkalitolerans TaxID=2705290 RepID=A0ABX0FBB3_9BACL|nr:hypothetical protein [Saccharibacillus alkalitolerans]NGZ77675.1 hypothetical protein [Saccharibacillus alkalitolerans]
MENRLAFPCRACGSPAEMKTDDSREFEIVGKMDIVQWSDFVRADELPEPGAGIWARSVVMPRTGEIRFVQASYPFNQQIGDRFWTLFMPALSALNGWDDHPEEVDGSGMAECSFLEVVNRGEDQAWIAVRVESMIPLSEAARIFEPRRAARLRKNFEPFAPLNAERFGKWICITGSLQGNIGVWALIERTVQGGRMILYGEWEMHADLVFCGHLELSDDELAELLELAETNTEEA